MKLSVPQTVYLKDYQFPAFLCDEIQLNVDLQEEYALVKSQMKLKVHPQGSLTGDLILAGKELILESVELNGEKLNSSHYKLTPDSLTIFNVPAAFELTIQTRIKPQENTSLMGLYKSSGNFCTQCEAEGFRHITYFLDRPDVMTRFTTTISADATCYPILLSNGNKIASGELAGGRHWVRWEDPFKKPSYLFALVAGDLEEIKDEFVTQSGRKVQLRMYVTKGNREQCAYAMTSVKKAMRWDEENYKREYDLDIYMIVAVSDFNMGAMENKGLNIFNTKYILADPKMATDEDFIHVDSVIAHEYFHNWTGNRITCRDWFQLSLKEGLTIFRDQCFTADQISAAVARIKDVNSLRNTQFTEDAGPLAHPVRPESYIEINNFYTATVYEKGAEVIRMLRTLIGDDAFYKGMDLYFARYDGQAVTIEDFVKVMEEAANINLTQFRLWYSQAGTPILNIEDDFDAAKHRYTLKVTQSCSPTPGQPEKKPLHLPLIMGLLDSQGKEILQQNLQITQNQETFHFENIASRPIPSLLRNFSAPVIVKYPYQDADLALLFKQDKDDFNRWEAGQRYAIRLLLQLIIDYRHRQSLKLSQTFINVFQNVLENGQNNPFLLAELLTLPSERYLAEQMTVIDVNAIHVVREFMSLEIAKQLKPLLFTNYQRHHHSSYQINSEEIGHRQLKNLCLAYLMKLPEFIPEALQQFKQAMQSNMTDTLAALKTLVNHAGAEREEALALFYDTWQPHALVIDKWFAVQAAANLPNTLQQVQQLLQHPAFDLKNPNKVYALVGTFTRANPVYFHSLSGEGYQLLTDVVLQLNTLNPLIAARMVTPLTDWRRYDEGRQALMQTQLETILKHKKISKDVYELVSKSLKK